MQAARSAWGVAGCVSRGTLLGRVATAQLASSSSVTLLSLSPPVHTRPLQQHLRTYSKAAGRARHRGDSYSTGSHEVVLYGLPPTVTHNDIRHICYDTAPEPATVGEADEPKRNVPKRNLPLLLQQRESVLADIKHIRLLRTSTLAPNGKAVVTFVNHNSAHVFQQLVDRKTLTGKRILALEGRPPWSENDGDGHGPKASRAVKLLEEMQYASPGRVVLMKGLPIADMNAKRLENMLSRTYNLATDRIPMPPTGEVCRRREVVRTDGKPHLQDLGAIVELYDLTPIRSTTSFLVRTQTMADAMRLVRKWHRAPWTSEYPMSQEQEDSDEERQRQGMRGASGDNEGEEDLLSSQDESKEARPSLQDDPAHFNPKRFQLIADAYIMY